jgi:hypothetical protein
LGVKAIFTIQYNGNNANTKYPVNATARAPSHTDLRFKL